MSDRYRVLYDPSGTESTPCGVVIERPEGVEVVAPAEMCFPRWVSEPYIVSGPKLEAPLQVTPGNERYFNEVCHDLHRTFALGPELNAPPANVGQ